MVDEFNQTILSTEALPIAKEIILSFQGKEYVITRDNIPFTIGRDENCNLQIDSRFASRLHCKVFFDKRNFMLIDSSSNGTFIRNGSAQPLQLNKSVAPMAGSGCIKLGERITPNDKQLILYKAVYL